MTFWINQALETVERSVVSSDGGREEEAIGRVRGTV